MRYSKKNTVELQTSNRFTPERFGWLTLLVSLKWIVDEIRGRGKMNTNIKIRLRQYISQAICGRDIEEREGRIGWQACQSQAVLIRWQVNVRSMLIWQHTDADLSLSFGPYIDWCDSNKIHLFSQEYITSKMSCSLVHVHKTFVLPFLLWIPSS